MKKILFILLMLLGGRAQEAACAVFPISTEIQIGRVLPLIQKAPKGVCVTIGAERAFRLGSLFEDLPLIIMVDISPEITRFHRINRALLRAPTRLLYRRLRHEASWEEWAALGTDLTPEDFAWWEKNVRDIKEYPLPEELNRYEKVLGIERYRDFRKKLLEVYPLLSSQFNNNMKAFFLEVTWKQLKDLPSLPFSSEEFAVFVEDRRPGEWGAKFIEDPQMAVDVSEIVEYRLGNYLFDDVLYGRLHKMAVEGRIISLELDLSKRSNLEKLGEVLKKQAYPLAFLDMNNLYFHSYMGEGAFRKTLDYLLPFGDDRSLLLLMKNYADIGMAQFSIYIGFTFGHVKTWKREIFLENFLESIPSQLCPILDGRLYQKGDLLPFSLGETHSEVVRR